jgi:hypothetical protein
MNRSFAFSRFAVLLALVFATVLGGTGVLAQSPQARPSNSILFADIVPSEAAAIEQQFGGKLPIYEVVGSLLPASDQPGRIEGRWTLDFINFTDVPQDQIFLRLYPNFQDYGGGSMTVSNVSVAEQPVDPVTGADTSLIAIPLAAPLQPGERVNAALDFVTTIPLDPVSSYGMFGSFSDSSSYNLAQWLPLLAGWDPGTGWLLDVPNTVGDPVFSNSALFDITLTAPADITFVTSGTQVSQEALGPLTTHRWTAGPMRDFVMSAGTDLHVLSQQAGQTTINSWYFSGYEEAAAKVLEYAVDSFQIFSERFGPYPYTEMDLVQTRLGDQAAGVEFPGLMYIGTYHYVPTSDYLRFTTVHEVAHQWWYGIVGNNQYLHAFMDESMANESSMIYREVIDGPDGADLWIRDYLRRPFLTMLFGNMGDMVVHQPSADFQTNGPYGRTVYSKGALGFDAIRRAIGDDAFFQGLRSYVAEHRFGVAQPEDLLTALEDASGQDLSELWAHWFERTEGQLDFTPDDLMELNA